MSTFPELFEDRRRNFDDLATLRQQCYLLERLLKSNCSSICHQEFNREYSQQSCHHGQRRGYGRPGRIDFVNENEHAAHADFRWSRRCPSSDYQWRSCENEAVRNSCEIKPSYYYDEYSYYGEHTNNYRGYSEVNDEYVRDDARYSPNLNGLHLMKNLNWNCLTITTEEDDMKYIEEICRQADAAFEPLDRKSERSMRRTKRPPTNANENSRLDHESDSRKCDAKQLIRLANVDSERVEEISGHIVENDIVVNNTSLEIVEPELEEYFHAVTVLVQTEQHDSTASLSSDDDITPRSGNKEISELVTVNHEEKGPRNQDNSNVEREYSGRLNEASDRKLLLGSHKNILQRHYELRTWFELNGLVAPDKVLLDLLNPPGVKIAIGL